MMSKNAITLIELVIFIAVVSIAVCSFVYLFNISLEAVSKNQIMTRAIFLAEGLMEEIMDDNFYSFKLSNETNDANTFDIPDNTFSWFEPGWHYRIQYRYINPTYSDTTSGLASTAAEISSNCYTAASKICRSNFLRVLVEVWQERLPDKKARLWVILTPTSRRFYGENFDSF